MQKWEYEAEFTGDHHMSISELNERGQQGWELCGVTAVKAITVSLRYIFKRPIPSTVVM